MKSPEKFMFEVLQMPIEKQILFAFSFMGLFCTGLVVISELFK